MISNQGLKVGYILKVFPRVSETFVLNEILELERQGVEVKIFSLKAPSDPRFHGALGLLRAPVTYLARGDSGATWGETETRQAAGWDGAATGAALLKCLEWEGRNGFKLFPHALLLAIEAERRGVQHFHAHFATLAARTARLASLISGRSFSVTAHAKDINHQDVSEGVLREIVERAAFVATVTDHNVGRLEKVNPLGLGTIHRLYNGIDLNRFAYEPPPLEEPPEILSVGRLVEKKGFPYLIEACRILKDRGRVFRCTIIGGGVEEQALRDRIAELSLGDVVRLAGVQSSEEVNAAMGRAALLALPCIVAEDGNQDALPTVMLEAMARGRPVVSTDLDSVNEIVDHLETGFTVPQRDSVALADAVERLLVDRDLRAAFGRAGRRKAERAFDLRSNVGRLRELFVEATGDQPAQQTKTVPETVGV